MSNETLDQLEAQQEQAAPNRVDRARLFKNDPEIIKAVEGYKDEIAAIRKADEELGEDIKRVAKLNEALEDSEIRNAIGQWRDLAALPPKIEAGIAWLNNLTDADFEELPYPKSDDDWRRIFQRMAHRLGDRCYVGAAANSMHLFHEQAMSRLAEIERTSRAQGKNPFARKKTATAVPEAHLSSDYLDFKVD